MSKRLPPLNALRVFDAAARHLSFTRAADELFVTQAAVSHQIKSLEDFLGLKLFRRRNRSLLLTEEGQSYFQDIKEIFSQLTEATRKLQARSAKGALTVSLLPSFAIQWLVPRLSSFNSAYPGIDVRIQAVDRQEDKLADDVDPSAVTQDDIVENPHNIEFTEMKSLTIPAAIQDFDYVAITGSVVYNAGIDPSTALATEDIQDHLVLQVVVKEENKDAEWAKAIVDAYHSDEFKQYMEENNDGLWWIPDELK